jgi:hypothetical protein
MYAVLLTTYPYNIVVRINADAEFDEALSLAAPPTSPPLFVGLVVTRRGPNLRPYVASQLVLRSNQISWLLGPEFPCVNQWAR